MASVEERVIHIMEVQLGVDPEQVNRESTFKSLGADSLDVVEIVMALEEEFNLEIPEGEEEMIQTVGQAIDYLEKNISQ